MKKVQRTLAAVLAAMMLMALAGCSKGDVTKEVNSGLSDLKAQAAEPAVEPQTETPAEPKTDAASEPCIGARCRAGTGSYRRTGPCFRSCRKSRLSIGRWPEHPDSGGIRFGLYAGAQRDLPRPGWYKSVSPRFADIKLFPTDDPSHIFSGDPRITFELKSGLDKINYYYDDFENVEELAPRTIGGVEMAGRTYKNVGMLWTEYYGEMPTGGWLAIKISGVDIDPGTEGDTILNSVTFG